MVSNSDVLTLRMKGKWWDQIASGAKIVELRLATEYWTKRLANRSYSEIHLWRGYPKRSDASKMLRRRWVGATLANVVHEEFGPHPVSVYVIDVSEVVE